MQVKMRLEVNLVVSDAEEASEYYKNLLLAEVISTAHNQGKGMNETMLKLGGTEIKILEENEPLGLIAPKVAGGGSVWVNIYVDDIDKYFNHLVKEGANVMSPIQEFPDHGINAIISDKFNHVWVINQLF